MLEEWFANLGTTGMVVPDQFNERGMSDYERTGREVLSVVDPRRVGPAISVPARHTAVLGMAIHADRMGEAVRYP